MINEIAKLATIIITCICGDARIPFIDHSISINPRQHLNNSKSHLNPKVLVSYGISPTKTRKAVLLKQGRKSY